MLVPVEVVGAISRKDPLPNRLAILSRWEQTMSNWEQAGQLFLYPLDRSRMNNPNAIAQQNRLRGADSIIAALAQELSLPLKTFDQEILARYLQASV